MANIIRKQSDVQSASDEDLVATFNALTGKDVLVFKSRPIAEARVINAIVAASNASGHLGVPKHTEPPVLTAAERKKKGERSNPLADDDPGHGQDGPGLAPDESAGPKVGKKALAQSMTTEPDEENPYEPGTEPHRLWVATKSVERNSAPKAPKAPRAASSAAKIVAVRATTTGTSKMQETSERYAAFVWIRDLPGGAVTLADAIATRGPAVKGHIQKMLEKGHLVEITEEDALAAAKPQATTKKTGKK